MKTLWILTWIMLGIFIMGVLAATVLPDPQPCTYPHIEAKDKP